MSNLKLGRVVPRKRNIDYIQVIFKTIEVCNIACKYCSFFFGENQTYKAHPPTMSRETFATVFEFLERGAVENKLSKITIGFHGGEPLMQKKSDFDWMCQEFASLKKLVYLDLVVQSNGMLIDNEWIDLFSKYDVRPGISLDGPKIVNDRFRVDHHGRGTHDKVVNGIALVKAAAKQGKVREPSILAVINPKEDPVAIFNYFTKELELETIDFLLPQGQLFGTATEYGEYLCGLFDAWTESGNNRISMRFFRALVDKFQGHSSFIFPTGDDPITAAVFKISSDGRLYPDDVLHDESWWTPHVSETSLERWLNSDFFVQQTEMLQRLPLACVECPWAKVCGGGHPWHRFSHENGFDNPSSLCEGLKLIYAHVFRYLANLGYPQEKLYRCLNL